MAISDQQKLDFLFKKLGFGAAKTDTNALKAAVNEEIPSPLLLSGNNLWTDAAAIPSTKPSSSSDIVECYQDAAGGSNTVETSMLGTASTNRSWTTGLTDWIPPQFGASYQIKVYLDDAGEANPESTGTQLFAAGSGNNDEWFFDYQSGILHFIGTNLPSGISGKSIYVSGARYTGIKGVAVPGDTASFTDLNITGVSTFSDTVHISSLTNNRIPIVGSGSTIEDDANLTFDGSTLAVGVNLDVDGHTELDGVNISGVLTATTLNVTGGGSGSQANLTNLSVSGVSTFTGAIDANGSLDVDGHTELDDVNASGISSATAFANFDYLQAPFGSTVNLTVVVGSKDTSHRYNGTGSGSAYIINGVQSPFLTLTPGRTYRFNLSSSDQSSHPFRFYLEADKTTEYTTNVTTAATYTEITITDETPVVLHYQCAAHAYMGNAIQVNSNVVNTNYPATLRDSLTVSGDINANGNIVGDNSTNISGINQATATTFVGNLTGTASTATIAEYTSEWNITSNGSSDYRFTGPGFDGTENDPTIYLTRGEEYKFTNNMGAHPFQIRTAINGSAYNDGITNNGVSNGTLTWDVQMDAPNVLYYQCTAHAGMVGKIYIGNSGSSIDIDGHTELDTVNVSAASTFDGLLDINAGAQANTLKVEDLTDNRVVIAGTGGELEDDANLTFNGTQLAVGVNLDVDGRTELDITNISETLNVTGIATFANNIDANGDLDVDGHTELDDLRVSGVATFQSDIHLGDHDILTIGTGDDLKIYHNGNNSFVSHIGDGDLNITGDDIIIASAGFENKAKFITDGAVELYYDNSKKFETTGIGVSVSSGAGLTATIAGPSNLIIDPGTVGDNTGVVRIKGDLFVDGTQTQINSTTIELADFIVGVATTATSDLLSDGAGIQIGPNNTFLYEFNGGTNPSLKSSENLNVASEKVYQIDQTEVLSATTLGSSVVNSSLTNLGTLTSLSVSGDIDVDGRTELDITNISETLNVTGIATFADNIDANGDLDVDGHTELDHVNVSAASTFGGLIDINAGAQANTFKVEDLTSGRVVLAGTGGELEDSGNLTFNGTILTLTGNQTVSGTIDIDGQAIFDDITVSAASTFTGNIDANGNLDVDGHTELDSVNVSAASTFGGLVDINAGAQVNTLKVEDLTDNRIVLAGTGGELEDSAKLTFDETTLVLTGNQTVSGTIDVDGQAIFDDITVSAASTFTGNIDANGNLDVDGHTELDDVNVSGASTFTGNIDANGDLDVDGRTELDITNISETLNVTGISTFASNVDLNADLDVDGHTELDNLNVSGISTFTGNIDANGDLDVDGHTETDTLNVSGVSTLGTVKISSGIVTASSGVVTYYGDGSKLSNLAAAGAIEGLIVIDESGNTVGTSGSITTLSFEGSSGVTVTATSGPAGIATVVVGGFIADADENLVAGTDAGANLDGTSGCHNVFIGSCAGKSNTSGYENIFIGKDTAACGTVTGHQNIAIGSNAGKQLTTGCGNIFLGDEVGACNTTGNHNFIAMTNAGLTGTCSCDNVIIGINAGYANNGNANIFLGRCAGRDNSTGGYNLYLGCKTGQEATTGNYNVFLGHEAVSGGIVTGNDNISVGRKSGCCLTSGCQNIFLGLSAGKKITTAGDNIMIGRSVAAESTATACSNIVMGLEAGYNMGSACKNVMIGHQTGCDVTGHCNIFLGFHAGTNVTSGCDNIFLGTYSGGTAAGGIGNISIGKLSGRSVSSGDHNIFLGSCAGKLTESASNNIFLGRCAGCTNTSGSANIAIGKDVVLPSATASAQLAIGCGTNRWIAGDNSYNVGIGSATPSQKLDVAGNIAINQTTVVGSATSSLSSISQTAIHSGLSTSIYRSVEYTIQATQGTNFHATKILALHNGTTAYNNEYGTIYNNSSVATFDVDISGGNLRLLATGASTEQTDYVINFIGVKL